MERSAELRSGGSMFVLRPRRSRQLPGQRLRMRAPDHPPEPSRAATVTQLLQAAAAGDAQAANHLLPLVYEQLRTLARRRLSAERPDQTLQATALVHEAYLRLVKDADSPQWNGRWHFFAAAAEAMRRILVEHARRRARIKRGGGMRRVSLEHAELAVGGPSEELLALDEAITALAGQHPEKAQLVKLRFFAGLTTQDAAKALGISTSTAERHWVYARAWLYRHMNAREG